MTVHCVRHRKIWTVINKRQSSWLNYNYVTHLTAHKTRAEPGQLKRSSTRHASWTTTKECELLQSYEMKDANRALSVRRSIRQTSGSNITITHPSVPFHPIVSCPVPYSHIRQLLQPTHFSSRLKQSIWTSITAITHTSHNGLTDFTILTGKNDRLFKRCRFENVH